MRRRLERRSCSRIRNDSARGEVNKNVSTPNEGRMVSMGGFEEERSAQSSDRCSTDSFRCRDLTSALDRCLSRVHVVEGNTGLIVWRPFWRRLAQLTALSPSFPSPSGSCFILAETPQSFERHQYRSSAIEISRCPSIGCAAVSSQPSHGHALPLFGVSSATGVVCHPMQFLQPKLADL